MFARSPRNYGAVNDNDNPFNTIQRIARTPVKSQSPMKPLADENVRIKGARSPMKSPSARSPMKAFADENRIRTISARSPMKPLGARSPVKLSADENSRTARSPMKPLVVENSRTRTAKSAVKQLADAKEHVKVATPVKVMQDNSPVPRKYSPRRVVSHPSPMKSEISAPIPSISPNSYIIPSKSPVASSCSVLLPKPETVNESSDIAAANELADQIDAMLETYAFDCNDSQLDNSKFEKTNSSAVNVEGCEDHIIFFENEQLIPEPVISVSSNSPSSSHRGDICIPAPCVTVPQRVEAERERPVRALFPKEFRDYAQALPSPPSSTEALSSSLLTSFLQLDPQTMFNPCLFKGVSTSKSPSSRLLSLYTHGDSPAAAVVEVAPRTPRLVSRSPVVSHAVTLPFQRDSATVSMDVCGGSPGVPRRVEVDASTTATAHVSAVHSPSRSPVCEEDDLVPIIRKSALCRTPPAMSATTAAASPSIELQPVVECDENDMELMPLGVGSPICSPLPEVNDENVVLDAEISTSTNEEEHLESTVNYEGHVLSVLEEAPHKRSPNYINMVEQFRVTKNELNILREEIAQLKVSQMEYDKRSMNGEHGSQSTSDAIASSKQAIENLSLQQQIIHQRHVLRGVKFEKYELEAALRDARELGGKETTVIPPEMLMYLNPEELESAIALNEDAVCPLVTQLDCNSSDKRNEESADVAPVSAEPSPGGSEVVMQHVVKKSPIPVSPEVDSPCSSNLFEDFDANEADVEPQMNLSKSLEMDFNRQLDECDDLGSGRYARRGKTTVDILENAKATVAMRVPAPTKKSYRKVTTMKEKHVPVEVDEDKGGDENDVLARRYGGLGMKFKPFSVDSRSQVRHVQPGVFKDADKSANHCPVPMVTSHRSPKVVTVQNVNLMNDFNASNDIVNDVCVEDIQMKAEKATLSYSKQRKVKKVKSPELPTKRHRQKLAHTNSPFSPKATISSKSVTETTAATAVDALESSEKRGFEAFAADVQVFVAERFPSMSSQQLRMKIIGMWDFATTDEKALYMKTAPAPVQEKLRSTREPAPAHAVIVTEDTTAISSSTSEPARHETVVEQPVMLDSNASTNGSAASVKGTKKKRQHSVLLSPAGKVVSTTEESATIAEALTPSKSPAKKKNVRTSSRTEVGGRSTRSMSVKQKASLIAKTQKKNVKHIAETSDLSSLTVGEGEVNSVIAHEAKEKDVTNESYELGESLKLMMEKAEVESPVKATGRAKNGRGKAHKQKEHKENVVNVQRSAVSVDSVNLSPEAVIPKPSAVALDQVPATSAMFPNTYASRPSLLNSSVSTVHSSTSTVFSKQGRMKFGVPKLKARK